MGASWQWETSYIARIEDWAPAPEGAYQNSAVFQVSNVTLPPGQNSEIQEWGTPSELGSWHWVGPAGVKPDEPVP